MILLFGRAGLLVLLLVDQAQTAPIGAVTFRPTYPGIPPRSAHTLACTRITRSVY